MTREDAKNCLKLIQANYENFRPVDMTVTLDLWYASFKDDPAAQVRAAIWAIIQTSTSDFAPKIGQVREKMLSLSEEHPLNESEAWALVEKAIGNGLYGANEEYNKLPDDVKRAVGGPGQIRVWAASDEENITVVESNFKRTYRAVAAKSHEIAKLPIGMRPQIAPMAMAVIEEKVKRENVQRASPEFISQLMEQWRDEDDY